MKFTTLSPTITRLYSVLVLSLATCSCASVHLTPLATQNTATPDSNALKTCLSKASNPRLEVVGKTIQTPRYTMITLAQQDYSSPKQTTDTSISNGLLCIIDNHQQSVEITAIDRLIYQPPMINNTQMSTTR